MPTRRSFLAFAAAVSLIASSAAFAQDKSIVVSSTTSTQDSGLFGHILPLFKAKTGIDVKVVAQGTGQALDTGRPISQSDTGISPNTSRSATMVTAINGTPKNCPTRTRMGTCNVRMTSTTGLAP